ncbi:MAG: phosphoribosyltransferase [Chromatiales bacterium]|nr:phosphoribosyltransferase [Chromatiales bacterium]
MTRWKGRAAPMKQFIDRDDAGRRLAVALHQRLPGHRAGDGTVVLALPRGGVPVAAQVAAALGAPLGLLIVRKVGAPSQPELAMGAVASGGVVIRNEPVIRAIGLSEAAFARATALAEAELAAKERLYGTRAGPADIAGKTVILVDDGAATGATMRAAVAAAKKRSAARVVVALPTASEEAAAALATGADDLVCLDTPEPYFAVGYWYRDFAQVGDDEVARLLENAGRGGSATPAREA